MARIKVSGYITTEDDQHDPDSPTGLTEDAYMDLISDENGTGLKVADLDEVEVRVVG
jgi:hypothetical protein